MQWPRLGRPKPNLLVSVAAHTAVLHTAARRGLLVIVAQHIRVHLIVAQVLRHQPASILVLLINRQHQHRLLLAVQSVLLQMHTIIVAHIMGPLTYTYIMIRS